MGCAPGKQGIVSKAMIDRVGAVPLTLQRIVWPTDKNDGPSTLFLRGPTAVQPNGPGALNIPAGQSVDFCSYFNLFNLAQWRDFAPGRRLAGLALHLAGSGRVLLRLEDPFKPGVAFLEHEVDLVPGAGVRVPLEEIEARALSLTLRAETADARLKAGAFICDAPSIPVPKIALIITTFGRAEALQFTLNRLQGALAEDPDRPDILVIDNGRDLALPDTPGMRVIPNRNLGGAGGFSRGLLEARDAGYTHCIFSDDDASFHPDALTRVRAAVWLAGPARPLAVAGAMIAQSAPHELWEAGAIFDGFCRPLWNRADLTDRATLLQIAAAAREPFGPKAYAGWWFHAFPLTAVEKLPFPFFVRGDDSGFSLSNRFETVTLNGVAAVQEAFAVKETPRVHYLDMRYHLVHHLVFEALTRSRVGLCLVPLHLILRNLMRFHYESVAAQLLAWEDVLAGPERIRAQLDMSDRLALLAEMTVSERRRPAAELPKTPQASRCVSWNWRARARRLALLCTLNGHFVPLYRWFAPRITKRMDDRWNWRTDLGASEITFVEVDTEIGYSVTMSRRSCARLCWQAVRLSLRTLWQARRLKRDWRAGHDEMTTDSFWRDALF